MLQGHHHICDPLLIEVLLCTAWLYQFGRKGVFLTYYWFRTLALILHNPLCHNVYKMCSRIPSFHQLLSWSCWTWALGGGLTGEDRPLDDNAVLDAATWSEAAHLQVISRRWGCGWTSGRRPADWKLKATCCIPDAFWGLGLLHGAETFLWAPSHPVA